MLRRAALGLLVLGLVGCGKQTPQPAASAQLKVALDVSSLPGVYRLLPPGAAANSPDDVESLLLQKNGTLNIVFKGMTYGYYTVGKWTVVDDQIHLFPATVDQKDLKTTEADLQSGKIPSKERSKLEAMLKDRLVTPIFDKGPDATKLRVENPEVERAVEPNIGSGTVYLDRFSKL